MEFIFMLTRDDRTVDGALGAYHELAATDLQLVGFKDVGVSAETLRALTDAIHDDGRTAFLEVVSTSRDEELRSIEAAIAAGVDYVLGGTHVDDALDLLAGTSLRYCPFPGTIEGHPSELKGTIDEIADHTAALTARSGVTGVDLLAYRHRGVDPPTLVRAAVKASSGPVIVAGSVDSEARIREIADCGAWAFTIGGAILAGSLPGAPSLAAQVQWVLDVARR
jgi:hypothetical protein